MTQTFRHVLHGFDAAQVEAYVAEHRRRWWQGRSLAITVRGDDLTAYSGGGANYAAPVLRGTVRPGPDGAVVEGVLTRRTDALLRVVVLGATVLMGVVAMASLVGGGPLWLTIGALVAALALALVGRRDPRESELLHEGQANELRGELDVFFGLRERPGG